MKQSMTILLAFAVFVLGCGDRTSVLVAGCEQQRECEDMGQPAPPRGTTCEESTDALLESFADYSFECVDALVREAEARSASECGEPLICEQWAVTVECGFPRLPEPLDPALADCE